MGNESVSCAFMILLLGVIACSPAAEAWPADNPDVDRYAVYSLVLQTDVVDRENIDRLVILDRTTTLTSDEYWADLIPDLKEELGDLHENTVNDFRQRSQWAVGITASISVSVPTHFIDPERVDELVGEEREEEGSGWERFLKEYPGTTGWYVLSEVGFNSTKDQALVGFGAGSSRYALLTRQASGGWSVSKIWYRSINTDR